ncbi:hypothetical protein HBH98_070240 [Parastagonospora nodorum]|nr:hypothetical protein HBI10_105610 [Parastagonospora nodorum]KAH4010021.1 hypothetical protein HBI13_213060 [Parastagonospora nodorum]KAH4073932.1 hypothetical protein HBH50_040170 [Parastagonospora nodorum]KAH4091445.1 hypothetical protein HBH48_092490 [Parastagonospora nodorum]KAH4348623.1 hypothetical protein HBH98_070240 [Parastagonospora nodorum]
MSPADTRAGTASSTGGSTAKVLKVFQNFGACHPKAGLQASCSLVGWGSPRNSSAFTDPAPWSDVSIGQVYPARAIPCPVQSRHLIACCMHQSSAISRYRLNRLLGYPWCDRHPNSCIGHEWIAMHWLTTAPREGHLERTPKTFRHRNNQTTKLGEVVKAELRELLAYTNVASCVALTAVLCYLVLAK